MPGITNWFWGMQVTTTEHRGGIADLEDEMSLFTILYYTIQYYTILSYIIKG